MNDYSVSIDRPIKIKNPVQFHPFWFEDLDYETLKHFMASHWKLPFYVSLIYLAVIFSIQALMKRRPPLKLQKALILWNTVLGVFSILGFARVVPELWLLLSNGEFHNSICLNSTGINPPTAAWAVFFTFSKYVELGDTIFIVLRKQPLIFLQWYHHCASMVLAWQVTPFIEPISRYYGVMNYGVHGIMYPYFALKAMKIYIPRTFSFVLTSLQLLQMIVGVGVNLYSIYVLYNGGQCARDPYSIKWIAAVYGSFMFLFACFLYETYFSKNKKL